MVAELLASGAYPGAVEAERTVNSISNQKLVVEDHLSLKDAIATVRNAAQVASRIQAAFRAHRDGARILS
ncbi:hypothetical protein Tco_0837513 [Tanacetum coccineum]